MTDRIDDPRLDDELAARFARLAKVEAPDNWERTTTLAAHRGIDHNRSRRWWAAAAAAVLVVGGVLAVATFRDGDMQVQDSATSVVPIITEPAPVVSGPSTDVGTSVAPISFGSATVEPAQAKPGDLVTVTPDGVIQPTCGDLGAIFGVESRSAAPVRLGVLGTGQWLPDGPELTVPACLPPTTDAEMTYLVPVEAPSGTLIICRTIEYSDAACGRIELVAQSGDSIVVPVVEGLTEGDAVNALRALGLTVQVDRQEVTVGDPNDGRVISQSPAAATPVGIDDIVAITIGQATSSGEVDELVQTLIRFGADLDGTPVEAKTLDGATFCGSERTGTDGFLSDDIDVDGRRCLLDHHAARLPAVFVSELLTGGERHIVVVTRTRTDGTAVAWTEANSSSQAAGVWSSDECGPLYDLSNSLAPPVAFGCDGNLESLTDPIAIEPLPFPDWFAERAAVPTCGYFTPQVELRADREVDQPLSCMADAIDAAEAAELVTVHVGDDLRVARWIVSLGPSPDGTEQFEVASLIVDIRAGTTRWAEPRCVEGELVDGRLTGDFIVDREFVDQLDPSGTIVTDSGEVLIEPGPDERSQLQACNGPSRVERPSVSPFEATGLLIGDTGSQRYADFNEIGEYDLTVVPSWTPVGLADFDGVGGFIRSDGLEFPPSPDDIDWDDQFMVIYADDGRTRIGEFVEGAPVLD